MLNERIKSAQEMGRALDTADKLLQEYDDEVSTLLPAPDYQGVLMPPVRCKISFAGTCHPRCTCNGVLAPCGCDFGIFLHNLLCNATHLQHACKQALTHPLPIFADSH